jgi:dihydroorotate dehydrogenase
MQINVPTNVAGIRFQNLMMNGAYIHSKTVSDVKKLAQSSSGAVVVGSISAKPRKANPSQGYWSHKERFFSLNSYGLPNGGIAYFKDALPKMVDLTHRAGKPLIANVVGFSNEEFSDLIKLSGKAGVDMVELNFGCPNVWEKGSQKQILSYHPGQVESTLRYIAAQRPQIPLCIKLSPLPPDLLREVAQVISGFEIVRAVTATNSYPNSSITSGAKSGDDSSDILAGLAGRALKPISVGVVKQLRQVLPKDIAIFGCGGISSIRDVQDYIEAGVQAIQIATALCDEGTSVFDKIIFQSSHS